MIRLFEAEAAAKKAVKDAEIKLGELALAKYPTFTTDEIQQLVVDDKWGGTIAARIGAEAAALGQVLIGRLAALADRYEATVGELEAIRADLSSRVADHLVAMGVKP